MVASAFYGGKPAVGEATPLGVTRAATAGLRQRHASLTLVYSVRFSQRLALLGFAEGLARQDSGAVWAGVPPIQLRQDKTGASLHN